MDLRNMRLDYRKSKIDFESIDENPISLFLKWFNEALGVNKNEANACTLSTISFDNKPASRMVLLKDVSERGFVFFTNYTSQKSIDIHNNHHVALNFYWPELERQVRVGGEAKKIDAEDSDNYFKTRPRESQLGAWLSDQSSSIALDYDFTSSLRVLEDKFLGKEVTRPSNWGGYCIYPKNIEFWQGRPLRFHDRLLYELHSGEWHKKRLAP